jgi:ribosomal small subunit protein bTHX
MMGMIEGILPRPYEWGAYGGCGEETREVVGAFGGEAGLAGLGAGYLLQGFAEMPVFWRTKFPGDRRYAMGKGDKKSKRGKIFRKSHGKTRPKKKPKK